MNTCLLIVDVQMGFITDETKHILPNLLSICESRFFKHIFMTKFSNQADGPYRRILKWNKLTTPSERRIFLPLSSYAERVFEKSIYTSINAEFIDVLENLKIDSVLIAGLDTDCCVLTTAVDLFQNNITPIVLTDYCASNGGMESHKSAIIVLKRLIGENHVIDGLIDAQALKKIHEIVKESNSTEE